jgi:hypothetical protein
MRKSATGRPLPGAGGLQRLRCGGARVRASRRFRSWPAGRCPPWTSGHSRTAPRPPGWRRSRGRRGAAPAAWGCARTAPGSVSRWLPAPAGRCAGLGHVAHHAPVAAEHAAFVEARLAADQQVALACRWAAPGDRQVAEGRARPGRPAAASSVSSSQANCGISQGMAPRPSLRRQWRSRLRTAGAGHQAVLGRRFPSRRRRPGPAGCGSGARARRRRACGGHQPRSSARRPGRHQQRCRCVPSCSSGPGMPGSGLPAAGPGQRGEHHHRQRGISAAPACQPPRRAQHAGQQPSQDRPGPPRPQPSRNALAPRVRVTSISRPVRPWHRRRPPAYSMAREELTTIGASGCASRRARWRAASPPCAPMPGISSGSVGASSRTRAISAG